MEFDELQNIWLKQSKVSTKASASDLIKKGEAQIKKIKSSQIFTIAILSTLVIVLVGYFFWIGAQHFNGLTVGLALMILVIVIRVVIEWISAKRFNTINPSCSLNEYTHKMQRYYAWRKRVHTIFIPIIYVLYMLGFTLLLPAFKKNMSTGMYWYMILSGYGFLTLFALLMVRILKKEQELLKFLKTLS